MSKTKVSIESDVELVATLNPVDYTLVLSVSQGHRYFTIPDGRLCISDYSGYFPHQTDDGVLFVDYLAITRYGGIVVDDKGKCSIPLTNAEGIQCSTPTSLYEGCKVAKFLRCAVVVQGKERYEDIPDTLFFL